MIEVHGPVVAGSFYPAAPSRLAALVDRMIEAIDAAQVPGRLVGLIVPHAGYRYSGPVAASGYALLAGRPVDEVLLVGPSHFSWFEGLAVLPARRWRTPLGDVDIVSPPAAAGMIAAGEPFRSEHSLEVQLPFLQRLVPGTAVLPVLTGLVRAEEAAAALEVALAPGRLLVVSSDLSHYLDDRSAVVRDRATADAIVGRRPRDVREADACGQIAVRAALHLAIRNGWQVRLVDLRNSGDTGGDRTSVVGYGAFAIVAD